jgi:hypothetical protein
MTAKEIFKTRTGIQDDVAARYVKLAENRVRAYLRYNEFEDVAQFSDAVARIALYMYYEDVEAKAANESNVASESFSEGGVSTSRTYNTQAQTSTRSGYETLIDGVLEDLTQYIKGNRSVRFL